MKKKIVNVILSVAVVTSMIFSVTACGSKSETTSAEVVADDVVDESEAAESEAVESTVAEDTEEADTEEVTTEESSTEDADAEETDTDDEDVTSLDAWVNSEEADYIVEYMNEGLDGQSIAFEADGDVLSMVFTLDETLEIVDGVEDAMSSLFEAQKEVFEEIRDQLIDETGNDNISVRVVYINGDGTEIFSTEF